jgi:hypothetical protein
MDATPRGVGLMQALKSRTIRAHVFSNVDDTLFLKHFPDFNPAYQGIEFSFGLDLPAEYDVLIVYTRASYSIPTRLPQSRTAFVAAEPDAIHPYSTAFLNQFGIVVTGTDKALATEKWRTACCTLWFAGIDFSKPFTQEHLVGTDWFRALPLPPKERKISIVTSAKNFTPFHRKRLEFIGKLQELIPEHLVIYGRGHRSVDDKKDAMLPYAYHLAVENCDGPDLWTEKLSDPLLCWAIPFYAGCGNAHEYFPAEAIEYVDLDNPAAAARRMVDLLQSDHFNRTLDALTEARRRVLEDHNPANLLVRIVRACMAKPTTSTEFRKRLLRSERSLWPEAGSRGSRLEWALRNMALTIMPDAELRASRLQVAMEQARTKRRKAKTLRDEARRGGAN